MTRLLRASALATPIWSWRVIRTGNALAAAGLVRLTGASRSVAQVRPDAAPAGWAAFAAALDAYARSDGVVGATVVAVRAGRVVARHRYGVGDYQAGRPPEDSAVYHWASNTKTLTAIAIMQLRDRGRLTLDDPITRYVPELRQVHDPFGSMDDVTLRMLLSHSAGFQNPTWPYGSGQSWEPFGPTRWDQLVAMMPYQQVGFTPGSRFGYSNPGFIYLARVVEVVTGEPWAVYVQKNIWTPLGLTHSFAGVSPYHLAARRAASYTIRTDRSGHERAVPNPREFDPGITISNGGWNAPIGDLVAYVAFLSGAPTGDPSAARVYNGVLARPTLEEMWRPVVSLGPTGAGEAFGLSFYVFRRGARSVIGHTGEQSGFRSFFYLEPATATAVIGVLNTTNESRAEASARGWNTLTHRAVALVAP